MRWFYRSAAVAACVIAAIFCGCGFKNGGIEIGPVSFTLPVSAGVFDASAFPQASALPFAMGTLEQDLCALPTEDDLTDAFRMAGEIDLSSIVELSRVQLNKTMLTATSGDFSTVKAVQVYFVPKNGSIFNTVNLGGAFSLTGFGDTIEIEPPDDVDLLELIQENDALIGEDCPKLLIHVAGSAPDEAIQWNAEIDVDAYAMLGIF
ncbi:MAG: hypothetical protein IT364_13010 [Candidatus Hydrogenedentes bacterium]|nr:hypothetical protein [Candidatus Hydrogenedentota bacterium]